MERAKVRAKVTIGDPNGKGLLTKTVVTDAVIFCDDTVTLWLGGEQLDALAAYRQGAGSPIEVYSTSWVKAITFDPEDA